jgi:galactose-1-phosphate uridylyltransferase
VFSNRYPILEGTAPDPDGLNSDATRLLRSRVSGGAHEVVVLSPRHDAALATLSSAGAASALRVLQERMRSHLGAGRRYAQVFVNHDPAAGSSLDHPHAQMVAMEVVPIRSARARARQPRPQLRDGRRPASKADISIGPDGDNAVASRARQPVHCHVGSEPQTLDRVGVAAQQ